MKPAFSMWRLATLLCSVVLTLTLRAETVDLSAHVKLTKARGANHSAQRSSGDVVVWLTPTREAENVSAPRTPQRYTLEQKDKQFTPHILVVPTGSSVDFPNLDPFYHNVFSLFNGKRFDLGLYEAHTNRAVRFDRDGVSYIFCNIHPEMGAVIVTLSTPYYAISSRDGSVALHDVPPGSYRLHIWAENVPLDHLLALGRNVEIGPQNMSLAAISLETSGNVMNHHKNKFGESYAPVAKDPY